MLYWAYMNGQLCYTELGLTMWRRFPDELRPGEHVPHTDERIALWVELKLNPFHNADGDT